jgi:hypothetical protein
MVRRGRRRDRGTFSPVWFHYSFPTILWSRMVGKSQQLCNILTICITGGFPHPQQVKLWSPRGGGAGGRGFLSGEGVTTYGQLIISFSPIFNKSTSWWRKSGKFSAQMLARKYFLRELTFLQIFFKFTLLLGHKQFWILKTNNKYWKNNM